MRIKTILLFWFFGFSVFHPANVLANDNASRLLFENKCSRCHGLERIAQTVKTPAQWSFTVNRMREKDINWISDEEVQTIAVYLATHFTVNNSYHSNYSDLSRIPSYLPVLFGLITFCLLLITVIIGFVMTHGKRKLFKIHKNIAYITLASGVVHGILVIVTY